MTAEHASRRRGEALREAVFAAALEEISLVGVRGASMDSIAQRAGTVRRPCIAAGPMCAHWPWTCSSARWRAPLLSSSPDSGSLRDDLLSSLTALSKELDSDLGIVLRELISEAAHDPQVWEANPVRHRQAGRGHVGASARHRSRGLPSRSSTRTSWTCPPPSSCISSS